MEYRRLGRTGLKVSEISLGTWITVGGTVSDTDSRRLIFRAYDLGVNLFDTADCYADGRAEEVLGRVIKGLPREELVIATKGRIRMGPGPNGEGASRKHLVEALHASLRRLQLDYVDLYQIHWPDQETPQDETLSVLNDFVRQGKVLYLGCSNYTGKMLTEAMRLSREHHWSRYDSLQPCYNLFQREVEHDALPVCEKHGIGNIVYSPLAQGLLTGKYRAGQKPKPGQRGHDYPELLKCLEDKGTQRTLAALEAVAKRRGCTMSQAALAWVLRKPVISSAIVGASSVAQLEENVAASGIKLTAADVRALEGRR